MNSLVLDMDKINRCVSKLKESYLDTSIIERAVNTIDYDWNTHADLDFLRLGRWHYIPRAWFADPTVHPDTVFSDIGRGIAIGEEKHIVEKILANDAVSKVSVDTVDYRTIMDSARDLVAQMERPFSDLHFSLFVPIDYMVAIYTDWIKDPSVRIRFVGRDELIFNRLTMKIFWSSKYIDYSDFILLERSLCRWIAKPNIANRLNVEITDSGKLGKMELRARTEFSFTIRNPDRIKVLSPSHPSSKT